MFIGVKVLFKVNVLLFDFRVFNIWSILQNLKVWSCKMFVVIKLYYFVYTVCFQMLVRFFGWFFRWNVHAQPKQIIFGSVKDTANIFHFTKNQVRRFFVSRHFIWKIPSKTWLTFGHSLYVLAHSKLNIHILIVYYTIHFRCCFFRVLMTMRFLFSFFCLMFSHTLKSILRQNMSAYIKNRPKKLFFSFPTQIAWT